ncbi:MAG TPA: CoA transferase [Candidatus Baltobacteraceae bacterium]|jgi:crotonobetainyl-CoA:carnitine CoA-transferase CaiB-like acyl-CoA transferase
MKPLADVRILAVEQYGAGPWGTIHLADLGADVIKIEDPRTNGDVSRYVPPHQTGSDSLFFEAFNRNKRTLDLDLLSDAGRAVFLDLVRKSDAVFSNLRGDIPKKLRITYDDLKDANPRIVCCSLSGFGMTGPRSKDPAYDYILQGIAGWMSVTGEPDGPPTKSGLSVVDFAGGYVAALALMIGIHAARRDGKGVDCDTSLFDVAIGMTNYLATWNLSAGDVPERIGHSAHPSIFPFQNFQTADGWIVIACAKQKFWERFAETIGRGDLAQNARYADFTARREHRAELQAIIAPVMLAKKSADWLAILSGAGVPCGPVNTIPEALAEPHTTARDMIVEYDHPTLGRVRSVGTPVKVGAEVPEAHRAPLRNEHAATILRDLLDYDDTKIAKLGGEGAFGQVYAKI